MTGNRLATGIALVVLALLSGCASGVGAMVAELDEKDSRIELTGVPFYPQVTDQCGPAALAAVLNDADVPVTAAELKNLVYIPGRQGSLQLELVAATRHFGRIPWEVDPGLGALVSELESGRPVLVLQNLGFDAAPVWHYAVVVGYLPDERQFVLRSGTSERLVVGAKSFARSWQRGDAWAIVALAPGELPAGADAGRYLHALADVESTGTLDDAVGAYRAATDRWPDFGLAWLGLGNAYYGDGALPEAANAYRRLLDVEPRNAIGLNNLSQVYTELGCREEALATIAPALAAIDADDPVRGQLQETLEEARQSAAGADCPLLARSER